MQKKQLKKKEEVEKPLQELETQNTQASLQSVLKPVNVQYCPVCSLPFEFCNSGGKSLKCLEWKKKHKPELLTKQEESADQPQVKEVQNEQPEEKKEKTKGKNYIVFDISDRTKKKHLTNISGLQAFGINAKDFAKKCSKKFACSCAAISEDKVQIQGDISDVLPEFMEKEYSVKEKYVVDKETHKKKLKKLEEKGKKQNGQEEEKQPEKQPEKKVEEPQTVPEPGV